MLFGVGDLGINHCYEAASLQLSVKNQAFIRRLSYYYSQVIGIRSFGGNEFPIHIITGGKILFTGDCHNGSSIN